MSRSKCCALKQEVAPDHLWFTDDILGLDVDWIGAFADEVERASGRIPSRCSRE